MKRKLFDIGYHVAVYTTYKKARSEFTIEGMGDELSLVRDKRIDELKILHQVLGEILFEEAKKKADEKRKVQ